MKLKYLPYYLSTFFVWISRIAYCRGFGIHSPSIYRFVRYVINEHYPYYAYETLSAQSPDSPLQHKLGRLYFRLSNSQHTSTFIDYFPTNNLYHTYVQASRRNICYLPIHTAQLPSKSLLQEHHSPLLIRITPQSNYQDFLTSLLHDLPPTTILVLENIHSSKSTLRFWKRLIQHPDIQTTLDLYYCGIALFDKNLPDANYKINF